MDKSTQTTFKSFALAIFLLASLLGCAGAPEGGSDENPAGGNASQGANPPAKRPFPQQVSYAAESLRISNRSQAQLDDDVRVAYDRWKTHYLAAAKQDPQGRPRYRVKMNAGANEPTVSEGQGYGLIIVALMAGHDPEARKIFDGLWRFTSDHRSEIDKRLPDWYVNADESPDAKGNTSAFDGEADIAYGLLLADAQWGSDGKINYRAEALTLIQAMTESEIGPDSRLPMLGDFADPNGAKFNQYMTRTSDFMYGHFRSYARVTGNKMWLDVVASCQAAATRIQTGYAPVTGLLPDFLEPVSAADKSLRPASPNALEGATDGMYAANAGRVPWRIGTDWLLNGDPISRQQVQRISTWVQRAATGDPQKIEPGYRLDGTRFEADHYFSTFYVAPLGVAAMATPGQQDWLNAIYDSVRNEVQGYYEDSVTLLSMLVMTGHFWDPTQLP